MARYTIYCSMTKHYTLEIEASSYDEAEDYYEGYNGDEFDEADYTNWELISIDEAPEENNE